MPNIWYKIIRLYLIFSLHAYFKKITAVGQENIPKNKPVLFVSNHRNGLIDPILIGITSKRVHHFLTRASAFKNPIADFFLKSLKMIPIYRVRDGLKTIKKNEEIFEICYDIFDRKENIVIFPEGNHGLPRRVRRLSKGFTRIVFGYFEKYKKDDLLLVPIGLNYSNMQEKGSSVTVYYGKPILAFDYYNPKNEKEAIDSLKNKIRDSLKELTTHIDDVANHKKIEAVLTSKEINFLDPVKANKAIAQQDNWEVETSFKKKKNNLYQIIIRFIFRINTFIPILLWHKLKHKSNDFVLIPTFEFGISSGLMPLVYAIQALVLGVLTTTIWGYVYFFTSVLLVYLYKNSIQTDSLTTYPS